MNHLISPEEFQRISISLFEACGAPHPIASQVADTLLEASLSGYDSHGVMRVPRYVDECRKGIIVPNASPSISSSRGATFTLDGQSAFGPIVVRYAFSHAIERAQQYGVCCFVAKNTNDIARLGSYLDWVAQAGCVALLMANDSGGGPAVAPVGSATPFLSTNPIAAGIPVDGAEPVIIDISTAATSIGKLKMAANRGDLVPEGLLVDANGASERDPTTFFCTPRKSAILPLGGEQRGYKGFALSLIVEALAGALSGAGCSAGKREEFSHNGVFGMVINPDFFGGRALFCAAFKELLNQLHSISSAKGDGGAVQIPGERAAIERRRRRAVGIPVDEPTWARLKALCEELGVSVR